jgi:photosystem II stability/assembly factor-like uncharacterized protein
VKVPRSAVGPPRNPAWCPSVSRAVKSKKFVYWPAVLLSAGFLVAGCGGGNSAAPTTTAPAVSSTVAPSTTSPPATAASSTSMGTTTTVPASTASSTSVPTTKPVTENTVAGSQPAGGPVPTGFDPLSFTAISGDQYWLLGVAPCSNPVCTSIVRTTDGGGHFVGLPAPVAPITAAGGSGTGISTLRFADALDGYAFATGPGGEFWDTHDGGEHWAQQGFLSGRELMAFGTGGGYAFALVGSCQQGSCSGVVLERSPVGSDQWAALAVPGVSGGVDQLATMTVHGTNLWFSLTGPLTRAQQILVAGTGSGGSFTTYASPCFSGLGGTIEASSSEVLWAVCPTGMEAQAFRSTDGGAHWSTLNVGSLENSALLAPASDTAAVIEPSAQGQFLRTADGGATWQSVYPSGSGEFWWSWAGFTDSDTGSALRTESNPPAGWPFPNGPSPEQLWRSSDGGVTWSGPVAIG